MPSKVDPAICAKCKGVRRLCGRPKCPILERIRQNVIVYPLVNKKVLFSASPPSVLVGEYNYPNVSLGPLATPVSGLHAKEYEDYRNWWGVKSLDEIIKLRASMVFSKFNANIKDAHKTNNKLLEATQEIALASIPVDAEFFFKKPPKPTISFDGILSPIGPKTILSKLKVVENPIVPRKLDYLIYDTDVKASDAVYELYRAGIDVYHIVRVFSLGMLGEKRKRKLVPTRWSITAIDSMLGDKLLERVRTYKEISSTLIYKTEYIGNKYLIIMFPSSWTFEMIEIWRPRSVWVKAEKAYVVVNYEFKDGRWRKPGVDGGYHAIRFPILEYLNEIKRQALVIAIREVLPDYYAPVGSWQIRESIRNALRSKPIRVDDISEIVKIIKKEIITDLNTILKNSVVLRQLITGYSILKFLK